MSETKIESKRLTKKMKHSIKNTAEDWKFKKDQGKVKKLHEGLAEDIYNQLYSVELQEQLNILPNFMPRSSDYFSLSSNYTLKELCEAGGYDTEGTWFNNIYFYFKDEKSKIIIRSLLSAESITHLKKVNKKLYNRIAKYVAAKNLLTDRTAEFRLKLVELMGSIPTTKKLVELLPEAVHWIPDVYDCNDLPAADKVAELLDI